MRTPLAKEQKCPSSDHGSSHEKPLGRILIVAPEPFYEDRGTPIALRLLLEALSSRGEEVDLLTYPMGEPVDLPGLRTFRVGTHLPIRKVPIGFSFRKVVLDLLLIPAIVKLSLRGNYRCIHAVEEAAFLGVWLRPLHKLPVIYDMASCLPEQLMKHFFFRMSAVQKLLRFFERRLIRNIDRVVCSGGLREYVLRICPNATIDEWCFPGNRVEVSSEEAQRFREKLEIAAGSQVVVYTGNFEPYQGISKLLDAIPKVLLELPNTVFLLVGIDDSCDSNMREQADGLLKEGAVRLIPRRPKAEVYRYLSVADVVVSPREFGSNVALKVFDYMAAGKPIVATDSKAHRAVLNDDRALLVGLGTKDLSDAIIRLLKNRDMANRLGESARAYAQENLSWNAFVDRVGRLYRLGEDQEGPTGFPV
jgi:glycosyltransferase involved in cell wall biosynthesis